jgi:hypothetical protein
VPARIRRTPSRAGNLLEARGGGRPIGPLPASLPPGLPGRTDLRVGRSAAVDGRANAVGLVCHFVGLFSGSVELAACWVVREDGDGHTSGAVRGEDL